MKNFQPPLVISEIASLPGHWQVSPSHLVKLQMSVNFQLLPFPSMAHLREDGGHGQRHSDLPHTLPLPSGGCSGPAVPTQVADLPSGASVLWEELSSHLLPPGFSRLCPSPPSLT